MGFVPSAGSVHVDVFPDTKRFGPQLRTQLRAIAAKERPTVRINVRTNTGDVLTRLKAIDHQLDRLDRRRIRIDVTPDLDKFGTRLESRLSRVSQVAGAKAGRDAGDEFARRFDARLNRLAPKLHRLAQLRIESDAGKARADMVALDKLADRLDGRIVRMRVRTTGVQGLTGGPVGSGRPATQRPSAGRAPSAGAIDSLFQERLNKALNQLPNLSPDADGARGRLGMLRGELADLSSRRIGVDMDSGTAMGLVREMQRELHALSRSRDIDVRVNAGRARAELAALQAQANALDSTRPTINVGVRSNKQLEKFSDASPLATTAISALIPPAVPLAGAAVGGAAGLLPGLGAGMMGLGAFATAAIPGIMGVSKALDLQKEAAEGSEEAIEEYAAAMDAMTPQVRSLYDAWGDLQTVHSEWQTDLQGFTMPPLTRWLGLASDHMRQLTPIVAGTGKALDNLAQSADKGLTGPYWTSFIDFSARQAEPTLTSLGRTFGWLTLGVTGLMVSFEPLWESMSAGMERGAQGFAVWANEAENFTSMIEWTTQNGPILLGVLGDIGSAVWDLGVAIAPLGMVYAQGIGYLAQGLSWLAETSPGLLQLAVAAFTARMALQLLTRINQGMLVPLREGVGRVAEFAGSLRQVDSAATTAAGGTSRFSGALGGALGMLGGPWGIALLAATTALGVFIAKKQEAKAKTEEYTAALRDDTTATQENLRQQAAANLEKEGALQIAEQYGISTRDVTAAALGEADAMQRVTASIAEQEAYWEQAHKNGEISASTRDGAISQLVQLKGAIDAESEAMEGAVESASRVDEANGSATESQNGLNASMREGATVARDLKTALDDLTSGAVTVTAAESDFQAAVDRANESISTNGATLDLTTEAGRRNEQSLRDIRDRTNDLISAQKENGATTEVMISTQKSARDEFVRVAKQMGLTESAAQDLADEYLGLPHQVKTQIEVSASGTWTNVSTSTPGQQQQLFSTGGAVHGPGTATSDDIPAWLSNGEFVQRTAAVQKYGVGFMTALNEGQIPKEALPGFARGGHVSNGKGETPWARISSHQGNVRRDYVRMVRELTALVGDSMGEEFKNMMRGPQGVVRLAEASLGKYPEVPNGSNKNAITSWFGMNGAPWCAMYISWLFNRANASAALGGASRTAWTGDYYNSGMRRVSTPMPGDVAVYGTKHVNLVTSPGGGRRIGGNQSNNVTDAPYSGGAIFRPNWSKVGFASGGLVSMKDLMAQNLGEDRQAGQTGLVRSIREAVGLDERPVQRARGGRVRNGQWSWVGEEGPELVKFSSPGQVYSAQQSQAIAAQSARMQARGTDGSSAPLIGSQTIQVQSGEHAVREMVEEITHSMRVAKTGGRYSDD